MIVLLQVAGAAGQASPLDKLPTFKELIPIYGPFLTVVLIAVVAMLCMQYRWFSRALKEKNEEIKRGAEREKELRNILLDILDEKVQQS